MEEERVGAYERPGRENKSIQNCGWKSMKGESAWKTWVKEGKHY